MKIRILLSFLLLLALPVFAAAPVQQSQQTVDERVQLLERRLQALTDILLRLDQLQQEIQQLRGDVELQKHSMDALKNRQRDLYLDIDRRLGQMRAAPAPSSPVPAVTPPAPGTSAAPATAAPVPFATPPVGRSPAPSAPAATPMPGGSPVASISVGADPTQEKAAYDQAFDLLLKQRRYAEAIQAFRHFLLNYSAGEYADNAQYWLAEASYVTRDFDTALSEFTRVVQHYSASPKVPDALYKIGLVQYEKQQWSQARETLESVVTRYPGTTAAQMAQKRLERLRIEGH